MGFALQSFEPLAVGLRRSLGEQLAAAVRHLLAQGAPLGEAADPVEAVHEARKCLKRARTLLRLLRKAIGKAAARDSGAKLRALSQKLSSHRDRHMLLEAVDRLAQQTAASPFVEALAPVRAALIEKHPVQPLPEEVLRAVVPALRSVSATLEGQLLQVDEKRLRSSLRAGLLRLLRRGRRAYVLAYTEPSDTHFHEWRKRVKDIYYTACLLHLSRPQKLAPWVDALDELSDDLGDERDLGLLATALHEQPIGGLSAVALTLQLISRRREDLRLTARLGGQALYRRKARATTRFMTRGLRRKKAPAQVG